MSFWRKLCRKLCKPVAENAFARDAEHRCGVVLVVGLKKDDRSVYQRVQHCCKSRAAEHQNYSHCFVEFYLLWACGNHTEWRNIVKVSQIHVKSFRRIWLPYDVVRNLMFNLDVNRSIWKGPHVSLISSNTLKLRDHSVSFTVSNEGPPISMSSISSAVFPSTE